MNRVLGALVIAAVVVTGIGCAEPIVYLNRDVTKVVAMIPFEFEAQEAGCGEKLHAHFEQHLTNRGYAVVPKDQLIQWYQSKKYGVPDEAKAWSTAELCKEFKVDAVVWANISKWGKITTGIYNNIGIQFHVELQDKDGLKIWEGDGQADSSNTNLGGGRGGLFALIVNTVATAITDTEKYAPDACNKGFGSMPHAGWDPEVIKKREEDANKGNPAPLPDAPK